MITSGKASYSNGWHYGIRSVKTGSSGGLCASFRLATPEEIKIAKIPAITINGFSGVFFDDYVKFGCAEISADTFIEVNKFINTDRKGNRSIESVTIGIGVFNKNVIKKIADYYKKK
jgi:hypothetical protein